MKKKSALIVGTALLVSVGCTKKTSAPQAEKTEGASAPVTSASPLSPGFSLAQKPDSHSPTVESTIEAAKPEIPSSLPKARPAATSARTGKHGKTRRHGRLAGKRHGRSSLVAHHKSSRRKRGHRR